MRGGDKMTCKELVDFCLTRSICRECPCMKECYVYNEHFKFFPFELTIPGGAYSDTEIKTPKNII